MMIPAVVARAVFAALICATAMMVPQAVHAAPQASIVMDMRNGKVLQSRSADRKLHPASLTKMMTLYLTFEAVRDGRLRLDQKVRVSRHAARQPASKLYLKTGQRVTVRSLIRATAIKSANDAAMVLAEAVGGSQRGFAKMMTRKARRLGMKNTTFKNPHGLTQRGHLSTARDMAILGRHLFFDYPQYYNIFKRRTDYAAGKRIWTTNRLLSRYPGADGIKTGYTRAAGYNLVASATRGKKKVLAVIFGARNSADRTRKVSRLLDIGFSRAPRSVRKQRPTVKRARVRTASAPLPRIKPGTSSTLDVLNSAFGSQAQAATRSDFKSTTGARRNSKMAPRKSDMPVPRGGAKSKASRSVATLGGVPVPMPVPRPSKVASDQPQRLLARSAHRSAPPSWRAMIDGYASESEAMTDLIRVSELGVPGQGDRSFHISKLPGPRGDKAYALEMAKLSRDRAEEVCAALGVLRMACVVAPDLPGGS
ncbi:MAG: D-alanyl-D-alanine carboxypeptidase family protein [Pseudomonadota bacterium]